jgi:hypothetical protein
MIRTLIRILLLLLMLLLMVGCRSIFALIGWFSCFCTAALMKIFHAASFTQTWMIIMIFRQR